MAIAPDSILGQAVNTVTSQMSRLEAMSDKYNGQLLGSLGDLGNIKVADVNPPETIKPPEALPPQIDLGNMPEYQAPNLNIPDAPDSIDIDRLLSDLEVGDMDIPDAPEGIPINIPEAPTMASIPVPDRPYINTNVKIPGAPDIDMPEMEALEGIKIPDFEFPELPTFDAKPPSADGLQVPDVFINWQEPEYKSDLLDELQGEVGRLMEGGTGLPEAIQDALFSRTRDRASAETERAVQEAVDSWASRDFSMPPGMLIKQANVAREQGRLQAAETNRDIMIEASKWEIENLRFAVEQGMALEQLTTNLFENATARLFEAAKFQAEAKISVFDAQVSLFNAQNQAFDTLAKVYQTKLDGALSKLTAYKTAIDGQVALGQINQQKVDVFKAKLDAVQSNVEVYKAVMSGAKTRADVIKSQFDAYRADIQAYSEQVGAEKVKFDAYESRVKAESAKTDILDSQARAYASTVQAVSNKADIKVKGAQLKMDAARTKVTKFLADVDGFKAGLEASLAEVQYVTSAYNSQVEGWKAKASASVADAEMQSRFADMNTRTNIAHSEMQISEYTAKMNDSVQQAQIALESAKAMGQYTAQLAAGAMSAAHVSAGISGSGSASVSESQSKSTSTSHNYNY